MLKIVEINGVKDCPGEKIQVEVVYSARKSYGLEVQKNGRVIARFPLGTRDRAGLNFIRERREWIIQKSQMMEEKRQEEAQRPAKDYEEDPRLEAAYRRQAALRLRERADYFAVQMGVTYHRLSVGAAKTRWGSCSGKGNLNFNWKLILMPPEILDYVVVHELAHRKEMNHSPRFWQEVERILPDYRERRKWLKSYE